MFFVCYNYSILSILFRTLSVLPNSIDKATTDPVIKCLILKSKLSKLTPILDILAQFIFRVFLGCVTLHLTGSIDYSAVK